MWGDKNQMVAAIPPVSRLGKAAGSLWGLVLGQGLGFMDQFLPLGRRHQDKARQLGWGTSMSTRVSRALLAAEVDRTERGPSTPLSVRLRLQTGFAKFTLKQFFDWEMQSSCYCCQYCQAARKYKGKPRGIAEGMALPQRILFPLEEICMDWQQRQRPGAGLCNLGSTCYINVILQCLTYTPPLANYLLSRDHSQLCHRQGFCMMCIMEAHVRKVLCSSANAIWPRAVVRDLKFIGEEFEPDMAGDAYEFLRCALEAMQRACLSGNITCLRCQTVSDSYKAFLHVLLDIKIVEYPEYLDLRPYMSDTAGEPLLYSLYALVVHSGDTCLDGHFFCYTKASNGLWYKMDDESVDNCGIHAVLRQQAYLLFYARLKVSQMPKRESRQHCCPPKVTINSSTKKLEPMETIGQGSPLAATSGDLHQMQVELQSMFCAEGLTASVERQVEDMNKRQLVLKNLARTNCNAKCRRITEALPDDPSLLQMAQACAKARVHSYYILHVRSHTNLPGFVAEGSARADKLANPAWVAPQPDTLMQGKASHEFFHQNAHTLQKQFQLTPTEARDVVELCDDWHALAVPLPAGANPRGLRALEIWQTDVTQVAEFGRLKYVHVTVNTFSSVMWASAHTGEKTRDVIAHWRQAFAVLSMPSAVKTDNGPTYASQKVRQFLQLCNVSHRFGIPHSPTGQATVECVRGTLKWVLQKQKWGMQGETLHSRLAKALYTINHLTVPQNSNNPVILNHHLWLQASNEMHQPQAKVRVQNLVTEQWEGSYDLVTLGHSSKSRISLTCLVSSPSDHVRCHFRFYRESSTTTGVPTGSGCASGMTLGRSPWGTLRRPPELGHTHQDSCQCHQDHAPKIANSMQITSPNDAETMLQDGQQFKGYGPKMAPKLQGTQNGQQNKGHTPKMTSSAEALPQNGSSGGGQAKAANGDWWIRWCYVLIG
ncbi:hypothetical protein DUI87_22427 [Hirundo rustica rustica]|uniref:Ubiquitin carboxyl-terminal hydrolase n=1 Tax=Hirundo rustica rustica TaxID=333673 RepID=A0A3M0JNX1_HIRRU|nr:hypothetical protein DUI87_22427 [Hirundo rustica rustica]